MPEPSQGPARLGDPQALPSQTSARLGRAKLTSSLAWLGLLPSLLAASQTEEAPESLRYPESRRSTSEDSVTQEEAELSEKRTEPATSDNNTEPMAKACIEPVDVDNDEGSSDLDMRLGYFGLGLHDQMEVPEADKLLEVIGQIEG